jgi:hypothetical protein
MSCIVVLNSLYNQTACYIVTLIIIAVNIMECDFKSKKLGRHL